MSNTQNIKIKLTQQKIFKLRQGYGYLYTEDYLNKVKDIGDAASESAQEAESSADLSRAWAIGSDEEIPEQGEHSSKSNAAMAFAIANADEDVPIADFDMPGATFIKGDKGDAGPQLEACIEAINTNGNRVLSNIDSAQARVDVAVANIETNKDVVLNTAAEVLAYREQAEASAAAAAASEELANRFANAGEDEIIAIE